MSVSFFGCWASARELCPLAEAGKGLLLIVIPFFSLIVGRVDGCLRSDVFDCPRASTIAAAPARFRRLPAVLDAVIPALARPAPITSVGSISGASAVGMDRPFEWATV